MISRNRRKARNPIRAVPEICMVQWQSRRLAQRPCQMPQTTVSYLKDQVQGRRVTGPMSTILERIVVRKRQEIAEARARLSEEDLERRLRHAPPVRDFRAALEQPAGIQVIAEVKKASPSAGVLRADFDPVAIAQTYARHEAACISVLTDAPYFQGHLSDLTAIRATVTPPLLRKDF